MPRTQCDYLSLRRRFRSHPCPIRAVRITPRWHSATNQSRLGYRCCRTSDAHGDSIYGKTDDVGMSCACRPLASAALALALKLRIGCDLVANGATFERRVLMVAFAPSELAGVVETARARVVGSSSRLLQRQLSLPTIEDIDLMWTFRSGAPNRHDPVFSLASEFGAARNALRSWIRFSRRWAATFKVAASSAYSASSALARCARNTSSI
jgi:hypothetical protein